MAFDYPIILTEHDGRFRAAFPDFPGCYGEGRDRADAIDDARAEGIRCILQELPGGQTAHRMSRLRPGIREV